MSAKQENGVSLPWRKTLTIKGNLVNKATAGDAEAIAFCDYVK